MAESGASAGEMERVLEDLRALSGEVRAAAVISGGGSLVASTLPAGVERERFGAMLAALRGLAGRTARENGGGGFARARIGTDEGHVLLVGLDGGATLAATTGPDARVGLVLYDMRNVGRELDRLTGSENGGARMKRFLGRVAILGAAAGAVLVLRNYLQTTAGAKHGDVQIVLDDGATTVEPDPAVVQEFTDIARKALEIEAVSSE